MFLATLLCVITPTVAHLFFHLSVIERMISRTLSNLLELCLIMFHWLKWKPFSLAKTKTNSHPYKHELVDIA